MPTVDLGTLRIGVTTDGVSESVKDINKAKTAFENVQKSVGELDKQMELNQASYEAEISYIKSNTTVLNKNWQENKKAAIYRKQLADAVKNQEKKIKELTKGLEILEKSEEDNTDAVIDQKTEIAKAVKQLNEYKTELRETANEEITKNFNKIKSGIKTVTTAAVAMGTAIVGALTASAEATREYREDQAKLITAFDEGGFSAKTAKQSYADMYAILGEDDRSVEAANHLAELCDTEKELSDWSTICAGVMAKFGDSLPIEGLTEAANETAKVGQVTGPLADALNWAGVSEDAFNESLAACNSEQERSQLITSTLIGIYEDAGVQYKELNKDIIANRDAQRKMQEATAKVGEVMEPILARGKEMIAEFLTKLADWVSGNQGKIIGFANKVKDFVNFLIKHRRTIITMISSVGTAFLAWNVASMITKVVQSVKALTVVTKSATVAQTAMNAAMSANPFGAIAAAIGLVVGGVAAFAVTANDAAGEVDAMSEEVDELTASIKENKAATLEKISAGLSEMSHIESLKDELMNLADEQGNVADNDKARAQFILDELNNALDTEYSMTGNLISQYGNLCSSIDEVIEKKKGMIILESQEEGYRDAQGLAGELATAVATTGDAVITAEDNVIKSKEKLRELYKDLKEADAISFKTYTDFEIAVEEDWEQFISLPNEELKVVKDYVECNNILTEARKQHTDALKNQADNQAIINQYEQDSKNILEGNTAAVVSSYEARERGIKTYTEATQTEIKDQAETYASEYQHLLDLMADGREVDETYLEETRKRAELAFEQAELAGVALPEGLKAGIKKEMPKTMEEAKTQSTDLLEQMRLVFDINSPSKKTMDMGKFLVEGLWKGINGDTKWLIKKIKEFCGNSLDAIREYFDIHSPSRKTEEFGHYLVQGLAEGIKNDMTAEEALEQKCKNLTSILKEFTDSFDLDSSIAENELKLWKLENPNATPDEIAAAEKQILNRQLENQADAIEVTNQAYLKSVELTGATSEESQKLYQQLLQEKIAYEELLVAIENVNKERDEAQAKLYEENYKSYMARQEVLKAQAAADKEARRIQASSQRSSSSSQTFHSTSITQQFYTQTATPSQVKAATVKAMTSQEVVAAL